jgi:hypothetical protein
MLARPRLLDMEMLLLLPDDCRNALEPLGARAVGWRVAVGRETLELRSAESDRSGDAWSVPALGRDPPEGRFTRTTFVRRGAHSRTARRKRSDRHARSGVSWLALETIVRLRLKVDSGPLDGKGAYDRRTKDPAALRRLSGAENGPFCRISQPPRSSKVAPF